MRHTAHRVSVEVLPAPKGQYGDFYDFWVDTDPTQPGPEYLADVSLEVPGRSTVYTTSGFGKFDGKKACGGLRAHLASRTVTLAFARRCVGKPDRIQVSTHTSMEYETADWAPLRRRFGPWVTSGPAA